MEDVREKPKILLLDMPLSLHTAMTKRGFNASKGSLGRPYAVRASNELQIIHPCFDLPSITEQEIVIIDFRHEGVVSKPNTHYETISGQRYCYARCNYGVIDPRGEQAVVMKPDMDRSLESGGWFVVFAEPRIVHDTFTARKRNDGYEDPKAYPASLWQLNHILSGFGVHPDEGVEMTSCQLDTPLDKLISRYLEKSTFSCHLSYGSQWQPLLKNKHGQVVGCLVRSGQGGVIVLPSIAEMEEFVVELVADVLPEMAPHLFPTYSSNRWLHERLYELPKVVAIKSEQEQILLDARERVHALDEEIQKERAIKGWLHDLITGTDTVLVNAVTAALRSIGFHKVIDVDVELDAKGKSRREDLQIHDRDHVLVVDVKGVGGGTADDYALQADKHATLRLKEWRKSGPEHHPVIEDVSGLAIINHQRHLPPLQRENKTPFRQEMLDTADEHGTGLLTAWDLYRLVRNKERWSWKPEHVVPLLYGKGHIHSVPIHYQRIGVIAKAWPDKFGVVLEAGEIREGDTIAIEFHIEFEERVVESIHVNDAKVTSASVGDPTGLLWSSSLPKLRDGMVVYVVRPDLKKETE